MSHSCNCCLKNKREYIVSKKFRKCHHCINQRKLCSFIIFDLNWNKLISASNHLEQKKEKLNKHIINIYAYLNQIKKQHHLLQSRAEKFLQKNIKIVKKLKITEFRDQTVIVQIENDQYLLSLKFAKLFDFSFKSVNLSDLNFLNSSQISISESSSSSSSWWILMCFSYLNIFFI